MFYLLCLIFHCCNVRTWLSTFLSFVFLKGFFLSFLIFNGLWMSLFQVYATRIFWELQRKRKILGKWCQIVVPVYLFYLLVVDHHFGFKYLCSYWKINYQVELCCISHALISTTKIFSIMMCIHFLLYKNVGYFML